MNLLKSLALFLLIFFGLNTFAESNPIFKYTLDNGFTVIVKPNDNKDHVALRLFIKFGSVDEVDGQRGSAHILEHMLFKGTDKLSETDINHFCTKLQCHKNANTGHDKTCIVFDMPVDCWPEAMPVLAEMFAHSTIKQSFLDSEVGAILQEVRDRNSPIMELMYATLTQIFPEHPYHHPVIGYRKDIISANAQELQAIYKQNYIPNNAVLVVVGNVDPQEVFTQAKAHFGTLQADWSYKKQAHPVNINKMAQDIVHANDVANAKIYLFWKQQITQHDICPMKTFARLFTNSETARLHTLLVDDMKLVSKISTFTWDFIDANLFVLFFEPYHHEDTPKIIGLIKDALNNVANLGFAEDEIQNEIDDYKTAEYDFLKDNADQADFIGDSYLMFGDEHHPYTWIIDNAQTLNNQIKAFVHQHLPTVTMHTATLRPWNEQEKQAHQVKLTQEDLYQTTQLQNRTRTTDIEPTRYTSSMAVRTKKMPTQLELTPTQHTLSNGIEVVYINVPGKPVINFALLHRADDRYAKLRHTYKGVDLIFDTLTESGTESKPAAQLKKEASTLGLNYNFGQEKIAGNVRAKNLPQALAAFTDFIMHPRFDEAELDKIKQQATLGINNFWKNADSIADMLKHYLVVGKRAIPAIEIVNNFTAQECKELYAQIMFPNKASLIIVGDLSNYPDLINILEHTIGMWKQTDHDILDDKNLIPNDETIAIHDNEPTVLTHYCDQDGVEIIMFGKSISHSEDTCSLPPINLYQINLNQRLFALREKTGIFYGAGAKMLYKLGNQWRWIIRTSTSPDNVEKVIALLKDFMKHDIATFDQDELDKAIALFNEAISHQGDTADSIFSALLALKKMDLPYDFYQHITAELNAIRLEEIKKQASQYLDIDHCHIVLVGRKGVIDKCTIAQA